jgi:glycosyltransferase involved in cell wall biosynthesis
MKILHALQMPLLQQGGVEVLVRTLIEDAPADLAIALASQDDPDDLANSQFAHLIPSHLQVPKGELAQQWGRTLANWVIKHQIDLCHFHLSGTYGWRAGRWRGCPIRDVAETGIPTVTTNHQAITFFDRSRPSSPFWRKCVGSASVWPGKARQLSAIRWEAMVSQHDLATTRRNYPGLGNRMIQIYHSRLDADHPVLPAPPSNIILNVATVAFRKGQHLLVEAFARIARDFPDWRLQIVGTLAEKACVDHIDAIVHRESLADRVQLVGPVSDPTSHFANSEIYVQPSLLEGLGLSLQEAMFHGRACIGADCGGIPELILNPNVGLLYRADNIEALSAALLRLIRNPAERRCLGNAARISILNRGMTRQAMSATYRKLYQKELPAC